MNKRTRIYKTMTAAIVLLGAVGAWASDGNNNQVRLRAKLMGSAAVGQAPEGNADFRSDDKGRTRLDVSAEHTGLPNATVLTVSLTHAGVSTAIGSITVKAGEAELELDSQNGAIVPAVMAGDVITVSNGAQAILAGVF